MLIQLSSGDLGSYGEDRLGSGGGAPTDFEARRRYRRGVALPAVQPSTRPDQSRVVCGDGGLQAIADAQFRQHALHVALHGGLREVELRTDLGVRQAACDQEQYVYLPS